MNYLRLAVQPALTSCFSDLQHMVAAYVFILTTPAHSASVDEIYFIRSSR